LVSRTVRTLPLKHPTVSHHVYRPSTLGRCRRGPRSRQPPTADEGRQRHRLTTGRCHVGGFTSRGDLWSIHGVDWKRLWAYISGAVCRDESLQARVVSVDKCVIGRSSHSVSGDEQCAVFFLLSCDTLQNRQSVLPTTQELSRPSKRPDEPRRRRSLARSARRATRRGGQLFNRTCVFSSSSSLSLFLRRLVSFTAAHEPLHPGLDRSTNLTTKPASAMSR